MYIIQRVAVYSRGTFGHDIELLSWSGARLCRFDIKSVWFGCLGFCRLGYLNAPVILFVLLLTEQPIKDAVITVPGYFNQAERRAVLQAAHIAGLKVLQLINDNTAVALNYGVFRRKDINSTAQVHLRGLKGNLFDQQCISQWCCLWVGLSEWPTSGILVMQNVIFK